MTTQELSGTRMIRCCPSRMSKSGFTEAGRLTPSTGLVLNLMLSLPVSSNIMAPIGKDFAILAIMPFIRLSSQTHPL